MHAIRRHGKSRARILYWFRTPPNVRVGRAPLDEDAIKAIEKSNPDVAFDWEKILEAQPVAQPIPDPRRLERRARRRERPNVPPAQPPLAEPGSAVLDSPGSDTADVSGPSGTRSDEFQAPDEHAPSNIVEAGTGDLAGVDADVDTGADAWPNPVGTTDSNSGAAGLVQSLVGAEGQARLRSRFAEIQARISECTLDAAAIEELRGRADLLNPDTWVTLDEARAGLDEYERRLEEVRRTLGPPRGRSRRGGRRRNRWGGGTAPGGSSLRPSGDASDTPPESPEPPVRDDPPESDSFD